MEDRTVKGNSYEDNIKLFDKIFSRYTLLIATQILPQSQTLLYMLDIENADNILEVACGDGLLATDIIFRKKETANYILSDITPIMLKTTELKLSKLEQSWESSKTIKEIITLKKNLHMDTFLKIKELKESNKLEYTTKYPIIFPSIKSKLYNLNNEVLSEIQSDSIDAYIASYSLHLVENPENMLKECLRVLKKGGRAAFSMFGNESLGYLFNIHDRLNEKYNIPNKHHIGFSFENKDFLKEYLNKIGFSKVVIWEQYLPNKILSDEELDNYVINSPFLNENKELLSKLENYDDYIAEYKQLYFDLVNKSGTPLGFQSNLVIVIK